MSLFLSVCIVLGVVAFVQANMRFHFSLDFRVKQPGNSTETINKTIIVENNQISMVDNDVTTKSPLGQWTDQEQFNAVTLQKVIDTRRSVQQLNAELSPLAGRSNDLARRVKLSLRYANEVDANLEHLTSFGQLVELMRKFVTLVDSLREPNAVGGIRSLEYVLLKLALEKFELLRQRQEIGELLEQAESAWQRYRSTQVVLTNNST